MAGKAARTVLVAQDGALSSAALRDKAAGTCEARSRPSATIDSSPSKWSDGRTVDARGVELDELEVLERQAGAGDHGVAVARARVRARRREPRPPVPCPHRLNTMRKTEKLKRMLDRTEGGDDRVLKCYVPPVARTVLWARKRWRVPSSMHMAMTPL